MTSLHASPRKVNIREACSLFGYSRQAYYKSLLEKEKRTLSEHILVELVNDIRQVMPRLGGRKLHKLLSDRLPGELSMGRDAFFALLARHGLSNRRHRYKPYTTDSRHRFKKYPNLIREFIPDRCNSLYVSDITYIEVQKGMFYYLSIVTDAYSRKIVGWWLSEDLKASSCISHAIGKH